MGRRAGKEREGLYLLCPDLRAVLAGSWSWGPWRIGPAGVSVDRPSNSSRRSEYRR